MPYICPIKPSPGGLPRVFYCVIFTSLLLSIGGCGRETQGMPGSHGAVGILSIPPSGFVRIVSRQIEDKQADTLHYNGA